MSCKRLCKVIKMLAIHNCFHIFLFLWLVANAYAKLSKCQQFTTKFGQLNEPVKLQTLMQSYQNVSNSQRRLLTYQKFVGCKRLCKVIKMLAIHNCYAVSTRDSAVANAYAKLSKCQQFTTKTFQFNSDFELQTLMQSYQNVSNSQPSGSGSIKLVGCKRFCKVIKMLAIHNYSNGQCRNFGVANAFAKLSKCQQFTTTHPVDVCKQMLQTLLQSYQNVSNSQLSLYQLKSTVCCKRFCKVIKMLAIHNKTIKVDDFIDAANAFAKLSKCQQFTT